MSPMADNTITQGGMQGLGSLLYVVKSEVGIDVVYILLDMCYNIAGHDTKRFLARMHKNPIVVLMLLPQLLPTSNWECIENQVYVSQNWVVYWYNKNGVTIF